MQTLTVTAIVLCLEWRKLSTELMFSWCAPVLLYQLLILTHFSSDPPESPGPFQPSQPSPDLLAAQSFMMKTQKETFKAPNQKEKSHYGV